MPVTRCAASQFCRHWVTMKQHRPGNRIRKYFAAIAAMISS